MGYDLHITRATDWTENIGVKIQADEWLALVQEDPDLNLDPSHGPYAVSWSGSKEPGWFDWYDGNVFTTDPSRATVGKMLALAETLAGMVQGDEGEVYESTRDWRARTT